MDEECEVQVGRRIYRSGEAEYLINRLPARLKDIKDLFLGTGAGSSAYSIIEQGRVDQLLQATLKDGQTRTLSCSSTADASRGVGWAAGPIPGKGLVYAAMMEGDRAFPGRMMADRLSRSFKDAGL